MKKSLSFLVLLGVTFYFCYRTGQGVGWVNDSAFDLFYLERSGSIAVIHSDPSRGPWFFTGDDAKRVVDDIKKEGATHAPRWIIRSVKEFKGQDM